MEKAVIYARYSSDKQTEQSIEGQVRECEKFAQSKGISIIGKYFDRALSGKVDKRPDFQRMVKDSNKKLFDYILVYQLDRFARNRYDSAHYKMMLKKNGVKVLSAKENIADDPSGILMETVLEGMAEYYSAELAQKVKRGHYESFLKGNNQGGGRCFGYDSIPNDPTSTRSSKKLAINTAEANVVRKIFDDYASGKKVTEIKTWLDINNIKGHHGNLLHKNGIMCMLKNTKYIGTMTYGEFTQEHVIPPIVDKDIFAKVQERIKANQRNTSVFRPIEKFMFTTKCFCGHCKAPMTADTGTARNGNTHRYYKCFNKKKAIKPCVKVQNKKEQFEDFIINEIMRLLNTNGMIENIARQLIAYNDELQTNPKIAIYEKRLAEIDKAMQNIIKAVEQGFFNQQSQERMLILESEKADLTWRLDGERLDVPIKLDLDETIFWFEQFAKGDPNDTKFKERLAETFVNKVIVWNNKILIVYNVKGTDNEKITVEQILDDYAKEQEKSPCGLNSSNLATDTSQRFNSEQCGGR